MISMNRGRRAFTLVELLVVIGIAAILAAILFPVFTQARDSARSATCLSNERQMGLAVQMYVQDNDERLFFYASTALPSRSRSGAVLPNAASVHPVRWWNALLPYMKNTGILTCPSDNLPTPSPDPQGNKTILRSYIAIRGAEALSLPQIDVPVETIIITEKRGRDAGGRPVTDSWIEPFNGDFAYDAASGRSALAANRHHGGMNCTFFDGHARWFRPETIDASKWLTGCSLVHAYPLVSDGMCDQSIPGCNNRRPDNICNAFSYP